jgi:chromosomal replication initiation ATPase DnaA
VPLWGIALPDLASRLAAAMGVAVGAPDDELIAGVMIKHFLDRQIRVDPAVATFLLGRIERSFAAVRRVVAALDKAALAEKRGITVPLAREVLRRLEFDS